jgi:ribonuclease Z
MDGHYKRVDGMDFTFLGTGAGLPAKERNVTSMALGFPEYDGDLWLFDCGEGTQRQILYTPVRLTHLSVIFVTHMHGDHLFGLPGLLGSRSFQSGEKPLTLVGPPGLGEFVETTLRLSETHLHYSIEVKEINGNGEVYQNEHFKVQAAELDHGIRCFGYRIEERDRPGELLVDKLIKRGVTPGPIYQQIKKQRSVTLADGTVLESADFLGEKQKGRIVTVIGDTRPCRAAARLADHADVLIHESTFRQCDERLAHAYHHSSSAQAAQIAKDANAGQLILTHVSSRYRQKDRQGMLGEARKIFSHTLLAKDFMTYQLMMKKRK